MPWRVEWRGSKLFLPSRYQSRSHLKAKRLCEFRRLKTPGKRTAILEWCRTPKTISDTLFFKTTRGKSLNSPTFFREMPWCHHIMQVCPQGAYANTNNDVTRTTLVPNSYTVFFEFFLFSVSLWRRANARNVRLYYPYWQYTDLFIFRFVSLLCLRSTLRLFLHTIYSLFISNAKDAAERLSILSILLEIYLGSNLQI